MAHQISLREAISFVLSENGSYTVEFTSAIAYGVSTSGGYIMGVIHKAAADFVSRIPRSATHTHPQNIALQFFRPTLPSPHIATITFKVCNTNKLSTTLHVQLVQDKTCLAGYITMTDLSSRGLFTTDTKWKLSPPPLPTSVQQLEADSDPNWIGYHSPFTAPQAFKPQSYIRYFMPIQKEDLHVNDTWFTPAWTDDDLPGGAVWTNEMIHFVLDNGIPLHFDIMDPRGKLIVRDATIKAAREQRRARQEGRSDEFRGEGLTTDKLLSWGLATVAITTHVRRLLPPEGTKWLFMRASTTGILDDRMDHDIFLLDVHGSLIASCHQVVQVIPSSSKDAKRSSL